MESKDDVCGQNCKKNSSPLINQMSDSLINKIGAQIEQGRLKIYSDGQKLKVYRHNSEKRTTYEERARYQKVKRQKQRALKYVKDLQKQQKLIERVIKSHEKDEKKEQKSKEKSTFDEKDRQEIKKLLKLGHQKKMKEKQKHQKIMNSFHLRMNAEREEQQKKIQKIKAERNQAIINNLNTMEQRQKKRKQFYEQSKKRIRLLKKVSYLHIINEQEDGKRKQKEFELEKKIMQLQSNDKYTDLSKLKNHQKKMKILEEQRKKERKKLKTELSKSQEDISITDCTKYKNKFHKLLQEEQKAKKEEQLDRISKQKQIKAKYRYFNENVRQNFKPKSQLKNRQTTNSVILESNQSKKSRALSTFQRNQQGNKNLQIAKKLKMESTKESRHKQRINSEPQKTKYSNYLQQLRNSRQQKTNTGAQQRLRKLLNSQIMICDYRQAKKMTDIAVEIEARSKKSEDERVLEAIFNKIQILKAFN